MPTKFVFVTFVVILLLAACGGAAEPAVQESAASTTGDSAEIAGDNEDDNAADSAATGGDESDADAEESADEVAGESVDPAADTGTVDTGADVGDEAPGEAVAGRPASGTDPDTGMAINPDTFVPGDEFIVRGTIISMNLTPTTSPEFLIEAPSGRKYRISSQDLAETFFDDGTELRPHEYRQGMLAQATVSLAPDAGPTDILRSEDLTLLRDE